MYDHAILLDDVMVALSRIRRFIKELEEDGKVYEQLFVQQCQLYSDQHGDLTRSGEHVRMLDDVDETREDYFDELDDHSRQDSMEGAFCLYCVSQCFVRVQSCTGSFLHQHVCVLYVRIIRAVLQLLLSWLLCRTTA